MNEAQNQVYWPGIKHHARTGCLWTPRQLHKLLPVAYIIIYLMGS